MWKYFTLLYKYQYCCSLQLKFPKKHLSCLKTVSNKHMQKMGNNISLNEKKMRMGGVWAILVQHTCCSSFLTRDSLDVPARDFTIKTCVCSIRRTAKGFKTETPCLYGNTSVTLQCHGNKHPVAELCNVCDSHKP